MGLIRWSKQNVDRHWFVSKFALVFYSFFFNLLSVCIYGAFARKGDDSEEGGTFGLVLDVFIIIVLLLERLMNSPKYAHKKNKIYNVVMKNLKRLFWLLILIDCILKVVRITTGTVGNPINIHTDGLPNDGMTSQQRGGYVSVVIISLIFDCALLSIWWEASIQTFHVIFIACNILQFLIAVTIMQVNLGHINLSFLNGIKKVQNLYVLTGAFAMGQAIIGLFLCVILNEKNRLNEIIGKMVLLYDVYLACIALLSLGCFCSSFYYLNSKYGFPISVPILFAVLLIVDCVSYICTRYFRVRYSNTNYVVEEYDLTSLTKQQKAGWAKLIDLNRRYNSGITGDQIISLMENYYTAELEGMRCKVLRVYKKKKDKKEKKKNKSNDDILLKENEEKNSDKEGSVDIKGGADENGQKNLLANPPLKEIKFPKLSAKDVTEAWDALDKEVVVFLPEQNLSDELPDEDLEEFKPLSKNQLKKLQKKAKPKKQQMDMDSLSNNTEKFYNELKNTEALVLLTIIDSFDLTERIPGFAGKVLSKLFGKNSKYPILCIKFGLLGFHWPFKRSTFFCSATKKPIARSAAVMYSISEWNKNNEKCTILLDPTYKDDFSEPGIRFSGWYKINLPNSHIIDLRPFRNKTAADYFKAVKYRSQENTFKADSGVVIETYDFDEKNCSDVVNMNQNIANSRSESGQSSTLLNPDWEFISRLGNYTNEEKYRSLLFLKVDDRIIASCVIFRLGETITSDIQGLDHEISKKYKAYFVMMQEVIKIALKEHVSFVDFGPTTENAKVDIGCKVVPLLGSIYPRNKIMGPLVQFAADQVDV
ncbi:uncharacterized protein RJT20DRAFT_113501 [Scheffersomyces xylosifermentans]|uniref:uncharacterized protein n=1 Tax=Scheffersomyces xylosifermentans TaxID=1304137 RepID=UPI00315D8FC2